MASTKRPPRNPTAWLAERSYLVKRKGSAQVQRVLVALTKPRKLGKGENGLASMSHSYGCVVQTGKVFTRHIVPGRDELEAMCHAILSIERFLISLAKVADVTDDNGKSFCVEEDGLFFGPIGAEYLKAHKTESRKKRR
jgi:hypothetical protein